MSNKVRRQCQPTRILSGQLAVVGREVQPCVIVGAGFERLIVCAVVCVVSSPFRVSSKYTQQTFWHITPSRDLGIAELLSTI